jgi:beta-barrel assembly-enhancing protease
MHQRAYVGSLLLVFLCCQAASAQIPRVLQGKINQAEKVASKLKDIEITEDEEIKLGEYVSAHIRAKYGVVQDAEIHRYISLVGTVVKERSDRGNLAYHFIILDTDGVNAFAAPGGFLHITRGALSLMKNEAELAGVLAHEIAHVTQKHTIRAIQKGKAVQMAANETSVSANPALFQRLKDETYKAVFAGFSREDELDADARGLATATAAGYAPAGLSAFLTTLKKRNADSKNPQGLFASHPEMDQRIQKLDALAKSRNWASGVEAQERFAKNVTYQPVDLVKIATAADGSANLAGDSKDDAKKDASGNENKKESRFSLSKAKNPLGSSGSTTQSAEVTGSGGSRGLDRERGAVGGANPALVPIVLTAADIAQFKKEANLKIG